MEANTMAAVVSAGAAAVAVLAPAGHWIVRKLSGTQYMTKAAFRSYQDESSRRCTECKEATKTSIAKIQSGSDESKEEMKKLRKLMLVLAIHNKVPSEDLKEFL